jgi:threonine dehydratase
VLYAPLFDDEVIVAGQGTVALEMLAEVPDLNNLVVAVGGGGLIAVMAAVAKSLRSNIEVVGVQTMRFPAMFNAIKSTHHLQGTSSIAEGIAVGTPGRITTEIIAQRVDDMVLVVDEGDIEQALVMLLEVEKTLAEGAGAAGLAALLKYAERFKGKRIGLVLCNGNIDPLLLAAIIQRGMVRAGRLARITNGMDAPTYKWHRYVPKLRGLSTISTDWSVHHESYDRWHRSGKECFSTARGQ